MSQSALTVKTYLIVLVALLGLAATYWGVSAQALQLGESAMVSGWVALAVMVLLMLFNTRKKLSMIPIVSARVWLVLHVVFGILLVLLFWLHIGTLWPTGLYEQIIAGLFYLVSLSGIGGYVLSRTVPSRLRHIGNEVIYERIPAEIYTLRETAKDAIAEATRASGNETLGREYEESLAWFFARPRFLLSHISGSGKPNAWKLTKQQSLKPFLTGEEDEHFDRIVELIDYKNQIDAHYANQSILKLWLFFHLPLAAALLLFVAWHVLLVHLFLL